MSFESKSTPVSERSGMNKGENSSQAYSSQNGKMHSSPLDSSSSCLDHCLRTKSNHTDFSDPDWRSFERVFAADVLPADCEKTSTFFTELVHMLLDYVRKTGDRSCKVLDFHQPHSLREMMSHCLDLHEEPQDLEQILSDCKETLKYCVKTGHPHFLNQISNSQNLISVAGEWLTAVTNANMFTYEVAPVFNLMEGIVLSRMCSLLGWPEGTGDGVFAPGGAVSNLYAVLVARHAVLPHVNSQGLRENPRLVMFESDQGHYSIRQAAMVMGIGTENVISVKSDRRGRMIPGELDVKLNEAKAAGSLPFFVSATAGKTVLGSFDQIEDIADVCERHGVWLHVDACFGGSVLLSKNHRHLLHGVHRAHSVSWNPHKLMCSTLQCSVILTRDKGLLDKCNASKAPYLFQPDKQYDTSYDTGDKTIQCGRRNDVFKLWLMWRAQGDSGFEKQIDHLMLLSRYLQSCLEKTEGFETVLPDPEFLNVCFWYVPPCLRHMNPGTERDKYLHLVAPKIKARMMEKGSLMIGYQPLGNLPNFFRVVISNPLLNECDIDFILDEIVRLGADLVF